MRTIDADALKEELKQYFTDGVLDGVSAKLAFSQVLHDIDNAPTVDTYTEDIVKMAIKAGYKDGYGMAKAKYENRPQGADMRKPNCVTCDHFGDCEGCERSSEE